MIDEESIPIRGFREADVAFLTPPPVVLFNNLLVAVLLLACSISQVLGPDMHDSRAR